MRRREFITLLGGGSVTSARHRSFYVLRLPSREYRVLVTDVLCCPRCNSAADVDSTRTCIFDVERGQRRTLPPLVPVADHETGRRVLNVLVRGARRDAVSAQTSSCCPAIDDNRGRRIRSPVLYLSVSDGRRERHDRAIPDVD